MTDELLLRTHVESQIQTSATSSAFIWKKPEESEAKPQQRRTKARAADVGDRKQSRRAGPSRPEHSPDLPVGSLHLHSTASKRLEGD